MVRRAGRWGMTCALGNGFGSTEKLAGDSWIASCPLTGGQIERCMS